MQTVVVRLAILASVIVGSAASAAAQSRTPWLDDRDAAAAARAARPDPWARTPAAARWQADETGELRPPPFDIELTFAGGSFEHRTDGTNLDGDTDAGLFRFRFEGFGRSGWGGGLELEGIGTDDDLFTANGFGVTEAASGELFGYGAYRVWSGRFSMPIRFGLFVRSYSIDQSPISEVEYRSAGVKVAVEPEIAFVHTRRVRFSGFAMLALAAGATEVETDPSTSSWDTSTATFALDLGLRVRMRVVTLGLAFMHRSEAIDQSDVTAGTTTNAVDTEFNGLGLTLGFVF